MQILVVGGGAREHALTWKLSRDPAVAVHCAPGNAGIAAVAALLPAGTGTPAEFLALADQVGADLTVVGPEAPLTEGIADLFEARGRLLLGPRREAARLESSKAFAKAFMARHRIPTAASETCDSADAARAVLASGRFGYPVVLKADGLAAGKGVIVAEDPVAASRALLALMVERRFGAAGDRIVIEECMRGPEVSVFALTDGQRAVILPTAQDHKRAFDGDLGPNTGGMGAFAPSPLVDDALLDRIRDTIVLPAIHGMRAEGTEFRGFLYAGLMLTPEGPKVVEFNVRLGDPEAQVVVPMIDGDLAPLLAAAAAGRLGEESCRVRDWPRVGVVLASGGYPDAFEKGKPISGLDAAESVPGVLVFHAGTARRDGQVVTAGGRVLTVVGEGQDFRQATSRAYEGASRIRFEGMRMRTDIGKKAVLAAEAGRGA
ncbi:MAG: purD [Acidobacteria bacterium]|nr:purD [Acidobacteriota bacterium]